MQEISITDFVVGFDKKLKLNDLVLVGSEIQRQTSFNHLDLSGLTIQCGLKFLGIDFAGPFLLDLARVSRSIYFENCTFCEGLSAVGTQFNGTVHFKDCEFKGGKQLRLTGSQVRGLLRIDRSDFESGVNLSTCRLKSGFKYRGNPQHAQAGFIEANDTAFNGVFEILNPRVLKIEMQGTTVTGRLLVQSNRPGRKDTESSLQLRLHGIAVQKDLQIAGPLRIALDVSDSDIGSDLDLSPGVIIEDEALLSGAHIAGQFSLKRVVILPTLIADNIDIGGSWDLSGAEIRGESMNQTFIASIWARDANIGGSLNLTEGNFLKGVNIARAVIGSNIFFGETKTQQFCSIGKGRLPISFGKPYTPGKQMPEEFSVFMVESKVRGSIYANKLKIEGAPFIADGASCFNITFEEDCSLSHLIDLSSCKIHGNFTGDNCIFGGGLFLSGSTINGNLSLESSTLGVVFESYPKESLKPRENESSNVGLWTALRSQLPCPSIKLSNAHIKGAANLAGITCAGPIQADFCKLESSLILDTLDLRRITTIGEGFHPEGFAYSLGLNGARIEGGLYARSVQFYGAVDLAICDVRGDVNLSGHIDKYPTFIGASVCYNFTGPDTICLWLRAGTIGGQLQVRNAYICGAICLVDAVLEGTADFDNSTVGNSKWKGTKTPSPFALDARSSTIKGPLRAYAAVLLGDVLLKDSSVSGIQISTPENVEESLPLIWGTLKADHTPISGSVSLTNCCIGHGIALQYSSIAGSLEVQWVSKQKTVFDSFIRAKEKSGDLIRNSLEHVFGYEYDEEKAYSGSGFKRTLRPSKISGFTFPHIVEIPDECQVGSLDRKNASIVVPDSSLRDIEEDKTENVSLMLQGIQVSGSVHMRSLKCIGGANLRACKITGALHLDPVGTKSSSFGVCHYRKRWFSLRLSNAEIGGYLIGESIKCKSSISVNNARIAGDVVLSKGEFGIGRWRNPQNKSCAILADQVSIGGDFLLEGVTLNGGGIESQGAVIAKRLSFKDCTVANFEEPSQFSFIDFSKSMVSGRADILYDYTSGGWLSLQGSRFSELVFNFSHGGNDVKVHENCSHLDSVKFDDLRFDCVDKIKKHVPRKQGFIMLLAFSGVLCAGFLVCSILMVLSEIRSLNVSTEMAPFLWVPGLAPGLVWAFCLVFAIRREHRILDNNAPGTELLLGSLVVMESSSYSQSFLVRTVDYLSMMGYRDYSDELFNQMKTRELKLLMAGSNFVTFLMVWSTKISTKTTFAVVGFLACWQVGIYAFAAKSAFPSIVVPAPGAIPVKMAEAIFSPLVVMLPFASLSRIDPVADNDSWIYVVIVNLIHLSGYVFTAIVVLYVTGLFRRHRHSGSLS